MLNKEYEIYHTQVFPFTKSGGNPCPVVLDANTLNADEMLRIARYYNLETGFVLDKNESFISLKYFVPKYEMEMCVHATIGSLNVILERTDLNIDQLKVKTPLGFINVELRTEQEKNVIFIEQFEPVFKENNPSIEEVSKALNINKSDIDLTLGPIQSVSSSRPKLIIPLVDYEVLSSLKPNYEYLWEICDKYNTTGFYPFTVHTRDASYDIEARQFPKNAGYPEDPATGVAAGALASYITKYDILINLVKNSIYKYKIGQGFDMGKPSIIYVENKKDSAKVSRPLVGGTAEIQKKSIIKIDNEKVWEE